MVRIFLVISYVCCGCVGVVCGHNNIYIYIYAFCINRLSQPLEVSFSKGTVLGNERCKLSCIVTPGIEFYIKR